MCLASVASLAVSCLLSAGSNGPHSMFLGGSETCCRGKRLRSTTGATTIPEDSTHSATIQAADLQTGSCIFVLQLCLSHYLSLSLGHARDVRRDTKNASWWPRPPSLDLSGSVWRQRGSKGKSCMKRRPEQPQLNVGFRQFCQRTKFNFPQPGCSGASQQAQNVHKYKYRYASAGS